MNPGLRPHVRPRVLQRWLDATAWTLFIAGLAGVLASGDLFWFAAGTLSAAAVAVTPVSTS